jgi:hypothetical protein
LEAKKDDVFAQFQAGHVVSLAREAATGAGGSLDVSSFTEKLKGFFARFLEYVGTNITERGLSAATKVADWTQKYAAGLSKHDATDLRTEMDRQIQAKPAAPNTKASKIRQRFMVPDSVTEESEPAAEKFSWERIGFEKLPLIDCRNLTGRW